MGITSERTPWTVGTGKTTQGHRSAGGVDTGGVNTKGGKNGGARRNPQRKKDERVVPPKQENCHRKKTKRQKIGN